MKLRIMRAIAAGLLIATLLSAGTMGYALPPTEIVAQAADG